MFITSEKEMEDHIVNKQIDDVIGWLESFYAPRDTKVTIRFLGRQVKICEGICDLLFSGVCEGSNEPVDFFVIAELKHSCADSRAFTQVLSYCNGLEALTCAPCYPCIISFGISNDLGSIGSAIGSHGKSQYLCLLSMNVTYTIQQLMPSPNRGYYRRFSPPAVVTALLEEEENGMDSNTPTN